MTQPILFQRIEGAAIFLGSVYVYNLLGANWLAFIIIFFLIDISMAGYLVNNKVGANIYNAGHTLIGPVVLYVAALALSDVMLTALSLIWFAHIGIDRALGYGFKLPSGFKDTHLGRIGKHK